MRHVQPGAVVLALVIAGGVGCGRVGFDALGPSDGGDGDGDGDGGVLDDGASICVTPDTSLFTDDFADGALSAWAMPVANSGGMVGEAGGVLVARDATNSSQAYWGSVNADLRGHETLVELLAVPASGSNAEAMMYWWAATDRVGVVVNGDGMTVMIGAMAQPVLVLPYDAVAHRWLRIVEAGGTTRVEASVDGRRFDPITEAATPASATSMQFTIGIQLVGGDGAVQEARFDNLNLPPACRVRR